MYFRFAGIFILMLCATPQSTFAQGMGRGIGTSEAEEKARILEEHKQTLGTLPEELAERQKSIGGNAVPLSFEDLRSAEWKKLEARARKASFMDVSGASYARLLDTGNPVLGINIDFHAYDIENIYPNNLTILAPTLRDLGGEPFRVRVDKEIDEVRLDGCLVWREKGAQEGQTTWEARDIKGETKEVQLPSYAKVKYNLPCDNNYIQAYLDKEEAAFKLVFGEGDPAEGEAHAYTSAASNPPETIYRPLVYTPQDTQNILSYETSLGMVENNAELRSILVAFIDLMKRGKLPTEFPFLLDGPGPLQYTLRPVNIDQRFHAAAVRGLGGACFATDPVDFEITGKNNKVYCKDQDKAALLTDNHDEIRNAGGFTLFRTGKKDDEIISQDGIDIIFLEKGWGKMKIRKLCSKTSAPAGKFQKKGEEQEKKVFGIGIQYSKGEGPLKIHGVVEGRPAQKAGLATGDTITEVNGVSLENVSSDEAAKMLMGDEGLAVTVKYLDASNGNKPVDATFQREYIYSKKQLVTYELDYKWPYPYNNFIVFGEGISENDIYRPSADRLVNLATGDEITFSPEACYNLVFGENAPKP